MESDTGQPPEGSQFGTSAYSLHAIHLVRTTQQQTLQLSQMADQKASILMGASFLVFSIAVSRAFAGQLPVSLAVLALFAFLSSMCAVVAVLPSVSPKGAPQSANKLFFGHFAARDEAEWTEDVLAQLRDDETVFRTMLHDIYQNGQVLRRKKYRFMTYAYRIFVVGLVVTLASFVVEMLRAY
jgi:ABC-type transport system involved in multi-copper enzyme maturation permease subunit